MSVQGQEEMISQIVDFVRQHRESQATVAVCQRILGRYPQEFDQETLSELRGNLKEAGWDEVESCYYLVM